MNFSEMKIILSTLSIVGKHEILFHREINTGLYAYPLKWNPLYNPYSHEDVAVPDSVNDLDSFVYDPDYTVDEAV